MRAFCERNADKGGNEDQQAGIRIVARALEEPLRQIASNSGEHAEVVDGSYGDNAASGEYEDLAEVGILDPAKVAGSPPSVIWPRKFVIGGNRMAKLAIKHWEDPVNLALGLWLLVSPWVLRYAAERSLMLSVIILGALISGVAGAALYRVAVWQRLASMMLGLCAIVDPWITEAGRANATLNSVITGWVVVALAVWTFANDQDIGGWGSPAVYSPDSVPNTPRTQKRRERSSAREPT